MAGSPGAPRSGRFRMARLLPLWSLLVFVVLVLSAGVAYERETARWVYCQGYAPTCVGQIQYAQLLAGVWLAGAAGIGVLLVFDRTARGRIPRWAPPPAAWLGYGIFLVGWGLLGIAAAEAQSYGVAPRGTGETFLHTYVIASLLLVAAWFLRPHPGGAVPKFATLLASVHGVVATVLAFTLAWGLAFPNVVST